MYGVRKGNRTPLSLLRRWVEELNKGQLNTQWGMNKRRYKKYSDKTRCRFCRENIDEIDYKDVQTLQKLCTAQQKLFSRKRSGNCARHQRKAKRAIKRARFLALMPYVT